MVPGNGPNFAPLVVVCTSAYGRPLTSLSFVCLRARDHIQAGNPFCTGNGLTLDILSQIVATNFPLYIQQSPFGSQHLPT